MTKKEWPFYALCFVSIIVVVLSVLKWNGHIDVSWELILMPWWLPIGFIGIMATVIYALLLIFSFMSWGLKKLGAPCD